MSKLAIAFSGQIKSGKSTLSQAIAQRLSCKRVSFGDYIRKLATERNLPTSREVLQELGESLVRRDPNSFCLNVLNQTTWKNDEHLVIDGLRHLVVAKCLQTLLQPKKLLIVFVTADDQIRERRHTFSEGPFAKLSSFDTHPMEREVTSILRHASHLIIDGTQDVEPALKLLTNFVSISLNPKA